MKKYTSNRRRKKAEKQRKKLQYNPDYVYTLGCYLLDLLPGELLDSSDTLAEDKKTFAEYYYIPLETVNKLIDGDVFLTKELINLLAKKAAEIGWDFYPDMLFDYFKRLENNSRSEIVNNKNIRHICYPGKDGKECDLDVMLSKIRPENIKYYLKKYGWEWDYLDCGDREDTADIMVYFHPDSEEPFVFLRDKKNRTRKSRKNIEYKIATLESLVLLANVTGITEWRWLELLTEPIKEEKEKEEEE